eukprot:COSAG01_NODE_24231_length_786_cov_0.675400_1_plen_58_part_01
MLPWPTQVGGGVRVYAGVLRKLAVDFLGRVGSARIIAGPCHGALVPHLHRAVGTGERD